MMRLLRGRACATSAPNCSKRYRAQMYAKVRVAPWDCRLRLLVCECGVRDPGSARRSYGALP